MQWVDFQSKFKMKTVLDCMHNGACQMQIVKMDLFFRKSCVETAYKISQQLLKLRRLTSKRRALNKKFSFFIPEGSLQSVIWM